ncbi:MAG: fatty acid desaturase [Pseudomonadota bacterium]
MFVDLILYKYYLKKFFFGEKKPGKWFARPASELLEAIAFTALVVTLVCLAINHGYLKEVVLFWFIPQRISLMLLAYLFDYIPNYPYDVSQADDRFKATNIRTGLRWILTPLLLWQNYHLLHHLHPRIPFHRYGHAWRAIEGSYKKYKPRYVASFALRD